MTIPIVGIQMVCMFGQSGDKVKTNIKLTAKIVPSSKLGRTDEATKLWFVSSSGFAGLLAFFAADHVFDDRDCI